MIFTIPGSRFHYPATICLGLCDRWGRMNPHIVVIIGWRGKMQSLFSAFSRRSRDGSQGRFLGRRFD